MRVATFRKEGKIVGESSADGGHGHGLGDPQADGLEQLPVPLQRGGLPPVIPEKSHLILGKHPREKGKANREPFAEHREVLGHERVDAQVLRDVATGLEEVERAHARRPWIPKDDHLFSVVDHPAPSFLHTTPNPIEVGGAVAACLAALILFAKLELQVVPHVVRVRARFFHRQSVLPDFAQRDRNPVEREKN